MCSSTKSSFLAHTGNGQGRTQPLEEHLENVAELAARFGEPAGIAALARCAGWWHDLGKVSPEFQKKLSLARPNYVDHKGAGAFWAYRCNIPEAAFAIYGHHGGLPSLTKLRNALTRKEASDQFKTLIALAQDALPPEWFRASASVQTLNDKLSIDLRTRLLFSCLVDADWLDTERHFAAVEREMSFPTLTELAERFFRNQVELLRRVESNQVNEVRRDLYVCAVAAAEQSPGLFTLTAPTGSGKTRAALGFVFTHQKKYGHHRVIVALPYTSILDQLAEEYERIFGLNAFLAHYTSFRGLDGEAHPDAIDEDAERRSNWAAENWEAPLILTTTVQLFDSLFSNLPRPCRKLHNIARSIIVLDEVQTLPVKYLEPICDILKRLMETYGVTVVLSSATQPDWERFLPAAREIYPRHPHAYEVLRRTRYEVRTEQSWSWVSVAEEMMTEPAAMTVVNTRGHALELYTVLLQCDPSALYLSTYLCGAHRLRVIDEVKRRLHAGQPCRLVTTQVVEAGVDLDFPLVLRAIGPLDRVVQAAGRCNREGKLDYGRVIVFLPQDNRMPSGSYKTGAGVFEGICAKGLFQPDNPETMRRYFKELFELRQCQTDAEGINDLRQHLDFETVAEKFHIIEDAFTQSVAVGYRAAETKHPWHQSPAERLVELLKSGREPSRIVMRRLQPFMVEVPTGLVEQGLRDGRIVFFRDVAVYAYLGEYAADVGLARMQQPSNEMNVI